MTADEFLRRLASARLNPATLNTVEPGATAEQLAAWDQAHPALPLPLELIALYRRACWHRLRSERRQPARVRAPAALEPHSPRA